MSQPPEAEFDDGYDGDRNTYTPEQQQQQSDALLCLQCDFKTESSSELARHQLKHNLNRSPLICKLCGFSTRWREELAQHQLEEHNVNPMDMSDDGEPMTSFIAPGTGQVIDLTDENTAIVIP